MVRLTPGISVRVSAAISSPYTAHSTTRYLGFSLSRPVCLAGCSFWGEARVLRNYASGSASVPQDVRQDEPAVAEDFMADVEEIEGIGEVEEETGTGIEAEGIEVDQPDVSDQTAVRSLHY